MAITDKLYPIINRNIRVVLAKRGYYRPLFWLKVGKDGSIYTSSTHKHPTFSFLAEELKGAKALNIDPTSQKMTTDREIMKRAKLSFHPSGSIHNALNMGDRGRPFWQHEELLPLCYMEFENPKNIKNAEPRKSDLILHVDEKDSLKSTMPITCNILLTSTEFDELKVLNHEPEKHFSLIFEDFEDIRKKDMCVHLVFNNHEVDFLPYTGYTYPKVVRKTITYHFAADGSVTTSEKQE